MTVLGRGRGWRGRGGGPKGIGTWAHTKTDRPRTASAPAPAPAPAPARNSTRAEGDDERGIHTQKKSQQCARQHSKRVVPLQGMRRHGTRCTRAVTSNMTRPQHSTHSWYKSGIWCHFRRARPLLIAVVVVVIVVVVAVAIAAVVSVLPRRRLLASCDPDGADFTRPTRFRLTPPGPAPQQVKGAMRFTPVRRPDHSTDRAPSS